MAPPARAGRDGVGPGGGCVTARTVFDTWHKKGSARLPVQSLKNKRQEHVNQPASFRHPKLNRQGRQAACSALPQSAGLGGATASELEPKRTPHPPRSLLQQRLLLPGQPALPGRGSLRARHQAAAPPPLAPVPRRDGPGLQPRPRRPRRFPLLRSRPPRHSLPPLSSTPRARLLLMPWRLPRPAQLPPGLALRHPAAALRPARHHRPSRPRALQGPAAGALRYIDLDT